MSFNTVTADAVAADDDHLDVGTCCELCFGLEISIGVRKAERLAHRVQYVR